MAKSEFNMHSRALFQDLRGEAEAMSLTAVNQSWVRAWQELADACDRLDAMFARNEIPSRPRRNQNWEFSSDEQSAAP